jgi:hypothetical protein
MGERCWNPDSYVIRRKNALNERGRRGGEKVTSKFESKGSICHIEEYLIFSYMETYKKTIKKILQKKL